MAGTVPTGPTSERLETEKMNDPRNRTRKWAAERPLATGVVAGVIFYLVELIATSDPVGTIPFALGTCAIFALTAYGERCRRRRKGLM